MTTNVPAIQFTAAGIIAPSVSDILTGVMADFNAAFGGNLNMSLSTPQGQLVSSLTAIIADCNDAFVALAQQVDPLYASGRMQDAIGNIYFISRLPALPTTVTATVTGKVNTVIDVGSQAVDTSGNIYYCTQAATIPSSGSMTTQFACSTTGPISCPINALSAIYGAIPGWDTITNLSAGVPGQDLETRAEFEYRRQQSVFINSEGSLQSIYAAVFNVANVIDCYVTENATNAPVTIGGQTLAANSIWVCVAGGAAVDIAKAIWSRKSPGCNYNGNTPTVVYDTNYAQPQPAYTVNWWTATPTPILFAVTIANNVYLPSNIVSLVKAAIVSAFAGGDGGAIARIASTIYASRYYAPISAIAVPPNVIVEILSLTLGIGSDSATFVTMGIDQIPTITAANIAVTVV